MEISRKGTLTMLPVYSLMWYIYHVTSNRPISSRISQDFQIYDTHIEQFWSMFVRAIHFFFFFFTFPQHFLSMVFTNRVVFR